MNTSDYEKRIAQLERENRILKQKINRSIENRVLLEEILETHSKALKTRNEELEQARAMLKKSEAKYRFLAHHDSLTGLPNRNLFNEELKKAISRAVISGTWVGLLFIDLDRFKYVNDTFGHELGDILLNQTAHRLSTCLPATSVLARIGGDEFAVMLEQVKNLETLEDHCRCIISSLSKPFDILDKACSIGASIGISIYPMDDTDTTNLLQKADAAMYSVKKSGANNFKFYHQGRASEKKGMK